MGPLMGRPMRVLFVCAGNICRSAMAEFFFRHIAESRPGLNHVEVASAGTIALDGNHPLSPCVTIMREFGIDMSSHRARRVRDGLEAELILTMDAMVTQQIRALAVKGPVQMLGEYAGSAGEIVDDPYGGSEDAYRGCAAQIERLVTRLADKLEAQATAGVAGSPE